MEYSKAVEIRNLVYKYGIYQERDTRGNLTGRMGIREVSEAQKNPKDFEKIKSFKQDMVEYFRKASGKDIEGLEEIRTAKRQIREWDAKFNSSFEGEYAVGGMGVGKRPKDNIAELTKKYPQAAAYLKAAAMASKSNYEMAEIGESAKWEVVFGDYVKAMADMDEKMKAFSRAHQWN